jgi:MoaA/NifB/PqqE/SkfB family radical SAM enzyme
VRSFIGLLPKIKNKSRIKIIGGEPLLHPVFFELAEEVIKNGHFLIVGTNFSLPNKHFEKISDFMTLEKQMDVIASLHLSQVQSADWFVDKVVSLKKYTGKKININVVSVLTEDNFLTLKNVRERLLLNNINFSFQRLKSDNIFQHYSPEVESYYQSTISSKINQNWSTNKERIVGLNTYGLMCKAGYSFLRINAKGNIYRCFEQNKGLNALGNINEVVWTLKKPLPCLSNKCICLLPVLKGLILFEKRDAKLAKRIEKIFAG